jgi:hypothetical protein
MRGIDVHDPVAFQVNLHEAVSLEALNERHGGHHRNRDELGRPVGRADRRAKPVEVSVPADEQPRAAAGAGSPWGRTPGGG